MPLVAGEFDVTSGASPHGFHTVVAKEGQAPYTRILTAEVDREKIGRYRAALRDVANIDAGAAILHDAEVLVN